MLRCNCGPQLPQLLVALSARLSQFLHRIHEQANMRHLRAYHLRKPLHLLHQQLLRLHLLCRAVHLLHGKRIQPQPESHGAARLLGRRRSC